MNIFIKKHKYNYPWVDLYVESDRTKVEEQINKEEFSNYRDTFLDLAREFGQMEDLDDADIVIKYLELIGNSLNSDEKEKLISLIQNF